MACVQRRFGRGRGQGSTVTITGRIGTAAAKERLYIKCAGKNRRRKLNEETGLCGVRRLRGREGKSV